MHTVLQSEMKGLTHKATVLKNKQTNQKPGHLLTSVKMLLNTENKTIICLLQRGLRIYLRPYSRWRDGSNIFHGAIFSNLSSLHYCMCVFVCHVHQPDCVCVKHQWMCVCWGLNTRHTESLQYASWSRFSVGNVLFTIHRDIRMEAHLSLSYTFPRIIISSFLCAK